MSEQLQKDFKIFKGEKVMYRDSGGHLSTRIIEDVVEVNVREDESFIAVTLVGDDGCYTDFNDITTLAQALDMFDLKLINVSDFFKPIPIERDGETKQFAIKGVLAEIT